MPSSIGGIMEYNSYAFGGAYYGRVYVAGYKKHLIRYDPVANKQVADKDDAFYPPSPSLDVVPLPAGAHFAANLDGNTLYINVPVDATLAANGNPSVYDVFPDRGLTSQSGPNTFIIGGANFNAITGELNTLHHY
jgi:hypothetical protein